MVKEKERLLRTIRQAEVVLHHQDDVHVVWLMLGGYVAAKHDESGKHPCRTRQMTGSNQSLTDGFALLGSGPEAIQDLLQRGLMHSNGQIAFAVKVGNRHGRSVPTLSS